MKGIVEIIALGIVLVLLIVVITFLVIRKESAQYLYDDVKTVPQAPTAMILGAALAGDGELSSVFKYRVDAAILLYKNDKADKILVTGDNGTVTHNEVNPVRTYLLEHGIPDTDIFLDHAGFDTHSSMYRARDIFEIESAIIVSQAFHLPRSVFIARRLGITAYGFSADKGRYRLSNYFREYLANVKAIGDLVLQRKPKYLGETIPIPEK
ncbi:MAG: ElyC/SanA/YdcF family protein [Patescibacteria group bacterium]